MLKRNIKTVLWMITAIVAVITTSISIHWFNQNKHLLGRAILSDKTETIEVSYLLRSESPLSFACIQTSRYNENKVENWITLEPYDSNNSIPDDLFNIMTNDEKRLRLTGQFYKVKRNDEKVFIYDKIEVID